MAGCGIFRCRTLIGIKGCGPHPIGDQINGALCSGLCKAELSVKAGFVGAGMVGSAAGYALTVLGGPAEIVLVYRNADLAVAQAGDIGHAMPFVQPCRMGAAYVRVSTHRRRSGRTRGRRAGGFNYRKLNARDCSSRRNGIPPGQRRRSGNREQWAECFRVYFSFAGRDGAAVGFFDHVAVARRQSLSLGD